MFPFIPPKYNYSSLISVGMPFVYEVGHKKLLQKMPRWDYLANQVGWIDHGKTGLLADAEVLAIQDDLVIFVLFQGRQPSLGTNGTPQYVVPLNNKNPTRGMIYHPYQWEWDGFFQPDGGWEQYLPLKEKKVCSCGSEAYAKLTNTPVSGHGTYCQKWQPNPYQR